MLVWAPPVTGTARGRPADRPTETEAEMAADRQQRPRWAGDGKCNWEGQPGTTASSNSSKFICQEAKIGMTAVQ